PTVPGGVGEDGVGTPDPDVPYVVGDWVEELTLDDLYPVDEPASDPSGDGSEQGPTLGDPPRTDDPADPMFRDPCADPAGESVEEDAEAAEERCPEGVGGTILLTDDGVPPNPLSIMAQFYIRISADVELRCPDLGTSVDGIYRPLFASNNPADFTIRYWPSVRPEEVREVTYRTSEAELDRWVERRLNGESIYADPRHGGHNCPEPPLPDEMDHEQQFTIEIDGVDDMGTRASVRIYDVIESAEAQLGRPPMAFGSRRGDANSGFVSLPYDPDEETAYLAAIPKTGPRSSELTCTDIEPHVLAHRMSADPVLGPVRVAAMARRPGDPEFDPRFSIAAISELRPDEGTSYLLCA